MKKSCGLCVDNGAGWELEILTNCTTGPVQICWPCLERRLSDLTLDLDPVRKSEGKEDVLSKIVGFTVTVKP